MKSLNLQIKLNIKLIVLRFCKKKLEFFEQIVMNSNFVLLFTKYIYKKKILD